jgi:CheY-like chemotaxis protein
VVVSRILVVDDEVVIGKLIVLNLGKDHEVVASTSPRETLMRLERGARFDVVFCDVAMPEIGGVQFCAEVSRIDREQARRIVFLTGGGSVELPRRSLAKPFRLDELREIVDSFIPISLSTAS